MNIKAKIFNYLLKVSTRSRLASIVLMKPRLMFVDHITANEVRWVWENVFLGIYCRNNDTRNVLLKKTHILEKGLQNIHRKKGHALNLVKEIKELSEPFQVGEMYGYITRLTDEHEILQSGMISDRVDEVGYVGLSIDPDDVLLNMEFRRSIRWYKDEIPSKELIRQVLSVANLAPNSCNRQPMRLYFTTDREKISKLLVLNSGATNMNIPPVFLSFTANMDSYILPIERHVGFIDVSLGAQNVCLYASANGLGTCILNWSHAKKEDEANLKSSMGIPDNEIIIFNMIMGFPLTSVDKPYKKNINEFVQDVD